MTLSDAKGLPAEFDTGDFAEELRLAREPTRPILPIKRPNKGRKPMSSDENTIKLTAKQDKFAVGIAAGLSQANAYRAAYNAVRMKADQVHVEASKLRNNPKIAIRIDELLKVARTEDVTNLGREIRRTMDLQQEALAAGNHSASASYQRMLMQTVGALREHLVLSYESSLSDNDLLELLSSGDPARRAAAQVLLGVAEGFPEGPPPEDHESETRH
jgi:hypothetical protein